MTSLRYISGYSAESQQQVAQLIDSNQLLPYLRSRYPTAHQVNNSRALYDYTQQLKNQFIKKSPPLNKVVYDGKIIHADRALGLHTYVGRVQGNKIKSKNEIKIAEVFKRLPLDMLKMIVVHELAHIKEKDHNKALYQLCCHMEPRYHQLEFDTRLFLTAIDLAID